MQYFTITYALLDLPSRRLTYAAAGHPGPLVVRKGEKHLALRPTSLAIGFTPDADFPECAVELSPGDRVFLYSDGIVEARSLDDEEFGIERLAEVLERGGGLPLSRAIREADAAAESFSAAINDDRTLVGLEVGEGKH
jgi:sigma-B regulation protein RsbU (phosphoserine phosphatase)